MAGSITDSIIRGCANIGMSRAMITDGVTMVSGFHEVITWEDDVKPAPSGDYGFMLRYEDIAYGSSMDFIHKLSYRDIPVQDFWNKHHTEIVEYCKQRQSYRVARGEQSAAATVEHLIADLNRGGKPMYSQQTIEAALTQVGGIGVTSIATDIQQYAVAVVLDDICRAYKEING